MADSQITQRAFNAGYLIEKYLPQLSKLLVKGFQDKESSFAQGFIAGCNEFSKEREPSKFKFLERLRDEFRDTPTPKKGRDDKEMEIDI